jgi:hypothetical protein
MVEINTGDIISTRTSTSIPTSSYKSVSKVHLPGFVIPLFVVIGTVFACGTVIILNPKLKST